MVPPGAGGSSWGGAGSKGAGGAAPCTPEICWEPPVGVGGARSSRSSPRPCSGMAWRIHLQEGCPLQGECHAAHAGRHRCRTASPNCTSSQRSRLPLCAECLRPQTESRPEGHSEGRGLAQHGLCYRHRRRSCEVGGLREA